jgi:glycosyltransferase involved in cell wall biosynthesis
LAKMFFRWADAIVAVSRGAADDFAATSGVPRNKMQVIFNPVVSDDLHRRAAETIDHPWFATGELPVVVAVGRLVIQKEFETLIRAFAEVRKSLPSRLMIIGEGPDRSKLESLTRELGLQDVVALPGTQNNPLPYMKHAALLAMSSRYEGLPLVPIEALAVGCPVVSTDCLTGPREILEEGKWGRLVPVGDVHALANAMLATLKEPRRVLPPEAILRFHRDTVARQYADVIYGRVSYHISTEPSDSLEIHA